MKQQFYILGITWMVFSAVVVLIYSGKENPPIPSFVNLYGQTIQVQRIATTTSLAGYYEPEKKLITINTATLNREGEITTLWHELHHAIYDHAMIGQWIKADSHDYSAHEKEEIIVRLISQETLYMIQHNNLPIK